MNVFISWSGTRSRRVAELLRIWIKDVIQATNPWVSSADISSGTVWFTEITKQLDATTQGILCLTSENKDKPWILFEAGALARGFNTSRLYTLRVDLNEGDITPPLSQFNHNEPTKESMLKLLLDINATLPDDIRLEKELLERGFNTNWPRFEFEFNKIIAETLVSATLESPKPNSDELLLEVLGSIRAIEKRIRDIETVHPQTGPSLSYPSSKSEIKKQWENKKWQPENMVAMIWEIKGLHADRLQVGEIIEKIVEAYPDFTRNEIQHIVTTDLYGV